MGKLPPLTAMHGMPPAIRWKAFASRVHVDPHLSLALGSTVYRYASLAEALLLIREGIWGFARPSLWPDKYESHVGDELFGQGRVFGSFAGLVKCVSLEHSSEAMWRCYASDGGLVRLAWRLGDLLQLLEAAHFGREGKVFAGRVYYLPPAALRAEVVRIGGDSGKRVSQNAVRPLLFKRNGFSFENEVRLCFMPKVRPRAAVAPARSNWLSGLQGVLLDPYLPAWQATALVDMFRAFVPASVPVSQSVFDSVHADGH